MPSFKDIIDKLEQMNNRYNKLCEMLEYEEVLLDKKLFLHLNKKMLLLKPVIEKYREYFQTLNNVEDLNNIIASEKSEKEVFISELNLEKQRLELLQQEILKLYVLQESRQEQILIEIVKSKGELATKLFDIIIDGYTNFLKKNFCEFNMEYKNNSLFIYASGENLKNYFEEEKGTHVVTLNNLESSCNVFIYFNIPNKTYSFSDNELEITTCRSSGAGGQHINKTESSIKIVHLPTGLVGISQDERSQFQNKQKALIRLKEKVAKFLEKERSEQILSQRKEQLKLTKNNVIRTYNLDTKKIVNVNKQQISLQDFLNGKILN